MPFQPLSKFLVRADFSQVGIKNIQTPQGVVQLHLDTKVRHEWHVPQVVEVIAVPKHIPQQYELDNKGKITDEPMFRFDTPIEVGDKIIVHHNCILEHLRISSSSIGMPDSEYCYLVGYENVWAKVENQTRYATDISRTDGVLLVTDHAVLIPLENWIFCSPILYDGSTSSGLVLPNLVLSETGVDSKDENKNPYELGKYEKQYATIKYLPAHYYDRLSVGDKIQFTKDADYKLDLGGELVYRMKYENIVGVWEKISN